jgi:hypothetical protein
MHRRLTVFAAQARYAALVVKLATQLYTGGGSLSPRLTTDLRVGFLRATRRKSRPTGRLNVSSVQKSIVF